MISLGIEGTAHTIGVGLVEYDPNKSCVKGGEGESSAWKILADVRKTYVPVAGIHPREAAQFMGENFRSCLDSAIDDAGISFSDIGLVSFSQGPGLGPCLRTVATGARALSLHYKIPVMGVNHCVAHIEVGRVLDGLTDPLVLYVSGGNTQILRLTGGRFRIFGETLDIGVGNMLDKLGRKTGLAHPAGPKIETLARSGKNYLELPYVVKGTDLSFSGVLTSAVNLYESSKCDLEDLCYSVQETAFSMLTEVTERALAHLKTKEVLLTGGVGNNKRLQDMINKMCNEHGVRFSVPRGYCSDNGAMIAILGLLMYNAGIRCGIDETKVLQKFRTDSVKVVW